MQPSISTSLNDGALRIGKDAANTLQLHWQLTRKGSALCSPFTTPPLSHTVLHVRLRFEGYWPMNTALCPIPLGLGYSNEEDMMVWLRIHLLCCQH